MMRKRVRGWPLAPTAVGGVEQVRAQFGALPYQSGKHLVAGTPTQQRQADESGGEQAMTELLGQGKQFTAVACYNDSMAAGAMGAGATGLRAGCPSNVCKRTETIRKNWILPPLQNHARWVNPQVLAQKCFWMSDFEHKAFV
mgnify:CR=1 FL=1